MTPSVAAPEVNPFSSHPAKNEGSDASEAQPVRRTEHGESLMTRMIEHQTAKIPSNYFLFASLCAMAASLALEIGNRPRTSRFIGMWAGPLLTMGVYNKMIKTFGAR